MHYVRLFLNRRQKAKPDEEEQRSNVPAKDYSIPEGETIRINIGGRKQKKASAPSSKENNNNGDSATIRKLAPPPSAASTIRKLAPPPPSK